MVSSTVLLSVVQNAGTDGCRGASQGGLNRGGILVLYVAFKRYTYSERRICIVVGICLESVSLFLNACELAWEAHLGFDSHH